MTADTASDAWRASALLTVDEMSRADRATIEAGTPGLDLMEAAGRSVADALCARWSTRETVVLCGPGNNGGDGFVIARLLAERGWPVRVALLGSKGKMKGDAGANAKRWSGEIEKVGPDCLGEAALVVDALFGAGLDRPVEGAAAETIERVNAGNVPCVAVDIPSGIHGDGGNVLGIAVKADLTVTFFRKKPAHLLLPGRLHCGETVLTRIGIDDGVLTDIGPRQFENRPELWLERLPRPTLLDHKYSRGHLLVAGGERMTGAARLAGRAALRTGTGMVTIAAPEKALPVYAVHTAAFLTVADNDPRQFAAMVESRKIAAIVVGPGLGRSNDTRARVKSALGSRKPVVIDADGVGVFEGAPEGLRSPGPKVLTPHEGEFARVFDLAGGKIERARAAARLVNGVIVLKGGDTVVAAPDGQAVITANAPAWLATAGAGDVLAGMIGGLLAQKVEPFHAALAACWMHGEAASRRGAGLIADDLPELLPAVLADLLQDRAG